MRYLWFLLAAAGCARHHSTEAVGAAGLGGTDLARWEASARRVAITRDDWGIAHVRGTTDADAVFGMIYAQAEDDFNRVETNYLNALGRLAEADGEGAVWQDLRMKLFINPDSMRAKYAASPVWLKALMDGWADGLNYYLRTHPDVKPRVITRFEPWMALTFSEGSIGGDIESIDVEQLEAFYDTTVARPEPSQVGLHARASLGEPSGSNGFAIAPSNTRNGRALLLINPHTSFFFRSELQMTSDEGLNAYGAATWGQFFLYQGFNDRLGWMHTSSTVDAIDEYAETVVRRGHRLFYKYGTGERPVTAERISVPYRTAGGMARREFTVYRTQHGPIVRSAEGKWIAVRLMEKPVEALSQSYLRTKARSLAEYRKVLELAANSSNNTVYADADGDIAYFHPQFIPRRSDRFDWTRPVDGSDPATEWGALHSVEESPHVVNPPNGWIQNTNNWPWSAAGPYSPKRESFPRYMDTDGENPRGINAQRVLQARKDFTLTTLIEAAFDTRLSAFERLVPPLLEAYDAAPASDPHKAELAGPIAALRGWDFRWSVTSVPTTLAVTWGEELWRRTAAEAGRAGVPAYEWMATRATPAQRLEALAAAAARLTADFGSWRKPWGEINRFQRLTGDIVQPFSDSGASIPVGFTSGRWGSLASFGTVTPPGTTRRYGTSGNSFVAVVEFGKDSVRARAVTAGGESGHPASPHFDDQAERYAKGGLRDVYFYPGQLAGHVEREYRPGK
jgi:acyl-homoserine-lactone acylase